MFALFDPFPIYIAMDVNYEKQRNKTNKEENILSCNFLLNPKLPKCILVLAG